MKRHSLMTAPSTKQPVMQGWLKKNSVSAPPLLKNWRKRFVCLRPDAPGSATGQLTWHESPSAAASGCLLLDGATTKLVQVGLELRVRTWPSGFAVGALNAVQASTACVELAVQAETVEAAVLSSASSVFPDMVDWLSRYQSAGYTVVVATASPRFLAEPVLARIGIGGVLLVAAEARLEDGVFHYESCYGAEKLARLRSRFPRRELGLVVSDSDSDSASLRAAKAEVMVSRGVKVSSRGVFPGMEP